MGVSGRTQIWRHSGELMDLCMAGALLCSALMRLTPLNNFELTVGGMGDVCDNVCVLMLDRDRGGDAGDDWEQVSRRV